MDSDASIEQGFGYIEQDLGCSKHPPRIRPERVFLFSVL